VGFVRRHPILTTLVVAALCVIGVVAASGVAVWQAAHKDEASRVDHADVILVLGAAQYGGRPSPVFESRLRHAVVLYEKGFAEFVVVLGANKPGDVTTEAEAGRVWLLANSDIPPENVSASPRGTTTLESLEAAAEFMREHDLETAFLVSDPWHNLRIRRMARDLGIQAYVSATGASAARTQWTRLAGYVRETFGYLYYRVLHR
jgi:uncharacterized SAM-binding protein YcdF (DUF218 family)